MKIRVFKNIVIIGLVTFISSSVLALPDVQVQGLFSNRAMLNIDGNVQLLRAGETSREGVKLVSADSEQATIEYDGERHQLSLSDRIGAGFTEPVRELRLRPDERGHYVARANINGKTIDVLVDTGATSVAMNSKHAKQLGLSLDDAEISHVSTASGIEQVKVVRLNSLTIGSISRNSIDAVVIDGDFPETVLLGNTFLSGFDLTVESGVLVLKQKI